MTLDELMDECARRARTGLCQFQLTVWIRQPAYSPEGYRHVSWCSRDVGHRGDCDFGAIPFPRAAP
jgi:hypothetical protein